MSKKLRSFNKSLLVHNISRGINGIKIFESDENKEKYLKLMRFNKEKYNIKILAYCIMDNHVHMLILSESVDDMSRYMHDINTKYGMNYNKYNERSGYVFQGRYISVPIMNEEQLVICIKYIHMNPVKAKIVLKEGEYEFSSSKWYKKPSDIIDYNVLIKIFGTMDNCVDKLEAEQIENIEKGKEEMKKIVNQVAIKNKIEVKEISKNPYLLSEICKECKEKGVPIYKNELAKQLKIHRSTLYRILRNATSGGGF